MSSCDTTCKKQTCCFMGVGEIYLKPYDPCCGQAGDEYIDQGYLSIGNASSFTMDVDITEINVPDYTKLAGGTDCSASWVSGARAAITGMCLKPENFARLWTGDQQNKLKETITLTVRAFARDSFIPFRDADGNPITNVDVASVSGFAAFGERGKDYIVTPNGIKIPQSSCLYLEYSNATVPIETCDGQTTGYMYPPNGLRDPEATVEVTNSSGDTIGWIYPATGTAHSTPVVLDCDNPVTVGFAVNEDGRFLEATGAVTTKGYNLIQLLTSTSKEYELQYSGFNRFSGEPFSFTLYRVKMKPVSGIPLIGDTAAEANWELEILKDDCRPEGAGFSSYGTLALI